MKTKNKVLFAICLYLGFYHMVNANNFNISQPNLSDYQNQYKYTDQDFNQAEKLKHFSLSLAEYITNEFNSSDFVEYFSQDGSHLIELLKVIKTIDFGEDNIIHSYTIFKIFNDKMKSADLIDHTVTHQLLTNIPQITSSYFSQKNYIETLKKQLERKITNLVKKHTITTQLYSPNLSKSLIDLIFKSYKKHQNQQEDIIKLKNIIIRFVETILSKTIWSSIYYQGSWESFTSLGHVIQEFKKANIIDDLDDIDSLTWSLVHRFNFYLDLTAPALPLEFFEEIEDDLESGLVPFLEEEEQDDYIKTKKETLSEALLKAKTRALAFQKAGIIS